MRLAVMLWVVGALPGPGLDLGRVAQGAPAAPAGMPALRRQATSTGTSTRLMVDGQPFLILGGELGNSTAASPASLQPIWSRLAALRLNTVLVPVYWELLEPTEGSFDFSSVDGVIQQARQRRLHVVLLWFGTWKNSMSCYAPAWVKRDAVRFPRAEVRGKPAAIEALSAFGSEGRDADARAFAALMRHLRQTDGTRHTVLMVQVENEVAMVEEAADRSAAAQHAFSAPVPRALLDFLIAHRSPAPPAPTAPAAPAAPPIPPTPAPATEASTLWGAMAWAWISAGAREAGTWTEVFGAGAATEEMFMAWYFARYVDAVARAGKAEYPLPMFVNAALNRPGAKPGQYPSGGPLPHLFDLWRVAAPTIDFLAPDIYLPNFADWTARYVRADNPLFVPEARNEADSGVNALYAIGAYQALGFSPFSVESIENPAASPLAGSYRLLAQIAPLVLAATPAPGPGATMTAVRLDRDNPSREITLGGYRVRLVHDYTWEWSGPARLAPSWPRAGAVIINTAPGNYLLAGSGVIATFAPDPNANPAPVISGAAGPTTEPVSGIERIEEGGYQNGKWIVSRRLNGDESHQGRHLRLPAGTFGIQRIWLYQTRSGSGQK